MTVDDEEGGYDVVRMRLTAQDFVLLSAAGRLAVGAVGTVVASPRKPIEEYSLVAVEASWVQSSAVEFDSASGMHRRMGLMA